MSKNLSSSDFVRCSICFKYPYILAYLIKDQKISRAVVFWVNRTVYQNFMLKYLYKISALIRVSRNFIQLSTSPSLSCVYAKIRGGGAQTPGSQLFGGGSIATSGFWAYRGHSFWSQRVVFDPSKYPSLFMYGMSGCVIERLFLVFFSFNLIRKYHPFAKIWHAAILPPSFQNRGLNPLNFGWILGGKNISLKKNMFWFWVLNQDGYLPKAQVTLVNSTKWRRTHFSSLDGLFV